MHALPALCRRSSPHHSLLLLMRMGPAFCLSLCLSLSLSVGLGPAAGQVSEYAGEEGLPRELDLPFLERTLPELQKIYADVLAPPQGQPAVPLAAGDPQAAELWRRLEAAQPRLRPPAPVCPPQLLRLLNEEMAALGLAWELRLRLDLAPGEDAMLAHHGVLRYGLPPHPGLHQALATGTLAQMLRTLADSLHATLTPCAGGKLLLVQGPSLQRLKAPLGTIRPVAEIARDFADLLYTAEGKKFADFALPGDDPVTAAMVRRLREVRLPRTLPRPVLFSQMVRFLNAEMARQQVPYEVCIDFYPGGRPKFVDGDFYHQGAWAAPRPDGVVTVGSCLAWLEKLNKGMLLCTDGRRILVMQGADSWFKPEALVEEPRGRGPGTGLGQDRHHQPPANSLDILRQQ